MNSFGHPGRQVPQYLVQVIFKAAGPKYIDRHEQLPLIKTKLLLNFVRRRVSTPDCCRIGCPGGSSFARTFLPRRPAFEFVIAFRI
jgi:hypothetical protein